MSTKVTMKDIAQRLGISVGSVSVALSNKPGVSEDLRRRIRQMCEEAGYNVEALSQKQQWNGYTIAFLVSARFMDRPEAFYTRMFLEAEAVSKQRQANLVLTSVSQSEEKKGILPACFQKPLRGVLLAGYFEPGYVERVRETGIPLLLLGYDVPSLSVDSVKCDDFWGAFNAVSYLVDQGHRKIGLIAGVKTHHDPFLRIHGYRAALHERGIALDPLMIVDDLPDSTVERGYEATRTVLQSVAAEVDAFFCVTDNYATGCMRACTDMGLSVPENISIMGFDDMPWVVHLSPPLTTVNIDVQSMGRVGIRRLFEQIEASERGEELKAHRIVIPVTLVIRESVSSRAVTAAK